MRSANEVWKEISVVNNLQWQFKLLGKEQDIPVLIAEDYLKFPDLVKDFCLTSSWWDNISDDDIRPGKSLLVHQDLVEWFTVPFAKSIAPLFGLEYIKTDVTFGNCFNGNMTLNDIRSPFPHVDITGQPDDMGDRLRSSPHIACNINITESEYPVTTGFWSFNNIKTILDCSYNDHRKTGLFYDSLTRQEGMKWFQIEDYGPWRLEDTVNMVYNSLVAYPTHFFHSPYIKEDWFTNTDRITISSFLNTSPENLDFKQKDLDDIAYAWEFFHLDKIHNYHPKKTVTT